METTILELHNNEWLSDALRRGGYGEYIPTNVILDKTLTGVGATYCEIHSKRNSIIIEPNVPVIQCKLDNDDMLLEGVYSEVRPMSLRKYLTRADIPHKKILTTPESFYKIRKEAESLGIDIYSEDWFCLLDECEKITQDHDYRNTISQPIYDFFRFKNKAMVSATPLTPTHPKLSEQGFIRLKLTPIFDYKKDLTLIVTNNFNTTLKSKLEELSDSPCVCIFMNKTDCINAIIEQYNISDYKVFCSEKSVKKLRERGISNVFSEINYPLAKYNFFTCRFYSGLDITIFPILPDIIMLTDLRVATYTMIDPLTEAIQIQGRFRGNGANGNTYNSLTHISTINPNMRIKSNAELAIELSQFADNYMNLTTQLKQTEDVIRKEAIAKDLKSLRYYALIDESGEINPFAVDNLYNEERVKSYYNSAETLYRAYEASEHFNVNLIENLYTVGDDDVLRISQSKTDIAKRKEIVIALEHIRLDLENRRIDTESAKAYIDALKRIDETAYILPIYKKIGFKGCVDCDYRKEALDKAIKEYDKKEANRRRFKPDVLTDIYNEFSLGVYISKEDIKSRLKRIYTQFGIKHKVTQSTIEDYYEAYNSQSKKPPSYKLIRFKYDGTIFEAPP